MSKVERYREGEVEMEPELDGEWVSYEDYAELQAENVKLKADWRIICDAAENIPAGTIEFRQQQTIIELQAQVLALQSCEVDANRYRWLKTTSFGGEHDHFIIFGNDPETGDSYPLGGDELDSLIDKDMQPLPLKAPPPIIRGEINLIPDGYYSIDAQPTSEKSHQKIGTITDAQVGSGGDNQSQPQPLSGEQP